MAGCTEIDRSGENGSRPSINGGQKQQVETWLWIKKGTYLKRPIYCIGLLVKGKMNKTVVTRVLLFHPRPNVRPLALIKVRPGQEIGYVVCNPRGRFHKVSLIVIKLYHARSSVSHAVPSC